MSVVDYFQSHAAGIGAMVGVLSFIGVFLWSIFKIAVGQVTTPKFTHLEQGQVTLEKNQIKLEQGQEQLKESHIDLKQGQTQLRQEMQNLADGQVKLREEVAELRGGITSVVAGQAALNQRLDRIETLLLEYQRQPVS